MTPCDFRLLFLHDFPLFSRDSTLPGYHLLDFSDFFFSSKNNLYSHLFISSASTINESVARQERYDRAVGNPRVDEDGGGRGGRGRGWRRGEKRRTQSRIQR